MDDDAGEEFVDEAENGGNTDGCENGCFLAGTPVLLGNGRTEEAINDIHVGERVATDGGVANSADGKTKAADPNATAVNQKTWREITITADDWDVEVLEPLSWIWSNHVKDGSEEPLSDFVNLAEMGVPAGLAGTVDSISACPAIQSGPGRVVLATVSHLNSDLYHLTLKNAAGKTETLGVTGYHRYYDVNLGWVHVQEMYTGEILRGADGNLTVTRLIRDPGTDRVYNMTVEADHVYYVGDLQALVHNACQTSGTTGQLHHAISNPILDAIEDSPNLAGQIPREVENLITQAIDLPAHNGYSDFFRSLDAEIIGDIQANQDWQPLDFISYLVNLYLTDPDLLSRFPGGLG